MKTFLLFTVLIALVIIASPFVISLFWTWVITDVFAGAVEQGFLPATLTWLQSFKLIILLAVLALTSKASSSRK